MRLLWMDMNTRGPLLKNEKYNSINEINETKKMAKIIISTIESIK